jgi:mono/diheme cytochrome c family protein
VKRVAGIVVAALLAGAAPVRAQPEGKQVFDHYCVQCHGDSAEATGTTQLARTRGKDKALLEKRDDLNAAYIEHVVRNGLRTMPPFVPSDLTDEKLKALTTYLLD